MVSLISSFEIINFIVREAKSKGRKAKFKGDYLIQAFSYE